MLPCRLQCHLPANKYMCGAYEGRYMESIAAISCNLVKRGAVPGQVLQLILYNQVKKDGSRLLLNTKFSQDFSFILHKVFTPPARHPAFQLLSAVYRTQA